MTDEYTVLRLAVYYRAVATASFLVGATIASLGVWLGLGDAIAVFLGSFLQGDAMSRTMAAANLPLTVLFVAVGVVVWQVGKAAAFYWTFTEALHSEFDGATADDSPNGDGAHDGEASVGSSVPAERPGDGTDGTTADGNGDPAVSSARQGGESLARGVGSELR